MTLQIPYDERAEREVVGVAVATPTGYALAAAVVKPDAFYVPGYRRLFAACASLADVPHTWDSAERIRCAAEAAEVDEDEVRRLVEDRGRFHDVHAEYARAVAREARRRRVMTACAEAHNAIGSGATVEEALQLVERAAA